MWLARGRNVNMNKTPSTTQNSIEFSCGLFVQAPSAVEFAPAVQVFGQFLESLMVITVSGDANARVTIFRE